MTSEQLLVRWTFLWLCLLGLASLIGMSWPYIRRRIDWWAEGRSFRRSIERWESHRKVLRADER